MLIKCPVVCRAFAAIQNVILDELASLSERELRPLLPCLVRMSLITPTDQSRRWADARKLILRMLSGIELVNSVVALLSIDFHALEMDVKKEQQLRQKLGGQHGDSILVQSLQDGLAMEFERSDAARRLRLLLSELLFIMAQVKESRQEFCKRSSELFDNEVYAEEVADVLCIAQAELPALLPVHEVAEALLRVTSGPWFICCLVANTPDSFREVCSVLISNGEKQDEETQSGRIRMQALHMLCQMNPSQSLLIRAKCVEHCRMPSLAVALTLDHAKNEPRNSESLNGTLGDLVAFTSGLLLGSDAGVRVWFSQFVCNGHKRRRDGGPSMLQALREELRQRLQNIVLFSTPQQKLPESKVVQASALLRLYCALKGIAGLKFHEDEVSLLLQLLTSHPPPSPAGVRFVSLGLCMLIACPALIATTDLERKAIEWIKWLVKEEAYFEKTSGVSASFGEMLLLIAIHFHSNQLNAISDLVCSTLGMKIPMRSNFMGHMKTIITQDIFTEQVVTTHAIKVPVTPDLSSAVTGFLPVHCIYQLLRSRAFTKHRVPIKDWIYRQICCSVPPLHPMLPPLIEAYVNSIIVPSAKGRVDGATNEPITEAEILAAFKGSVFTVFSGASSDATASGQVSRASTPVSMETDDDSVASMTSQLLLLYYLLLYEDSRLVNMRNIISSHREVKRYSPNFLAELPLKYLIQQAQKEQQKFAGLFSPLLRLLATHYPHLCLVEDWLYDETFSSWGTHFVPFVSFKGEQSRCSRHALHEAFSSMKTCPGQCMLLLQQLLGFTSRELWPFASNFVEKFRLLLEPEVPRQIIEMCRLVWLRLNTVFPGRLWVMSVNAMRSPGLPHLRTKLLTQDDLTLDPLHVLRCDDRIFRCAPLLDITLHMLRGFLAASRCHLQRHLLENPSNEKTGPAVSDAEREELRAALLLAQESAACQILLESMLPTESKEEKECQLSNLREVQTLICSHLHQTFIADPNLAKLVHFQGYPISLINIAVNGIPSMHICLDFIPELLSQPQLEKQVFAIHLASQLCLQYALPKSMSIARLVVNAMSTLLGVASSELRPHLFGPTLQSLVKIAVAFPPLCEDVASLFVQLGCMCRSQQAVAGDRIFCDSDWLDKPDDVDSSKDSSSSSCTLISEIRRAFSALCKEAILNNQIY